MKICPRCNTENPTKASHCMNCGCLLVDEKQMSEQEKLQRKLKEEQEEKELLKAALEAALKNNEKTARQVASPKLEKKAQNVNSGNELEDSSVRKSPKWPWVVGGLGALLLVAVIVFLFLTVSKSADENHTADNEVSQSEKSSKNEGDTENKGLQDVDYETVAKEVVEDFCRLSETCNANLVYKLFDNFVERFHDLSNVNVDVVVSSFASYDEKFGVIGEKKSIVRWDTFDCRKSDDGRIYIEYVEDYSIERKDATKPSIFVLRKHIVLNERHKIVSVYDEIMSRKKR